MIDRRIFSRAGLLAGLATLVSGAARGQEKTDGKASGQKTHRVAIQVSATERKVQELALVNAHNFAEHYSAKGEPFQIEIVAYGPGYAMVRDDISMVKGSIETLQQNLGDKLAVSACQNTRAAIAASMGKKLVEVPQLKGIVSTPSGIARLVELQEQGWSYVRP